MIKFPKENFVLLETNKFDKDNYRSFLFLNPHRIISCHRLEDVKESLFELGDFLSKGYYAAGFISYEAGFSFEEYLKGHIEKDLNFPLLWFGIYKKPLVFPHREKIDLLQNGKSPYAIKNLRPNISKKEYISNVNKIKNFIRRGDTYQVNYTFKYKFDFHGSLYGFYEDLKAKQSVSYSAFMKSPEFSILSLSPELFFRKNKNHMEVKPMKGTIQRGRDLQDDMRNINKLRHSLKDRSENVMIVDLLRNDLGRISRTGTVKTKGLFEVERYETLLQMISVVKSVLKRDVTPYSLFKAIFPSGSVTGAPKISTMNIINTLEKEPRHIYTGSIGFFSPGGIESVFNVAIRTVVIDNRTLSGEMGIGSGIVYDSDPCKEFEECRLKADFITHKKRDCRLIETILWRRKKGYFLLKYHMDRLFASLEYFNFKFDKNYIIVKLKNLEKHLEDDSDYKVRLLLDIDGKAELSYSAIRKDTKSAKVRMSLRKTSSKDVFLYHKTTNRDLYEEEFETWQRHGYFDVIFTNEKNQITEGAISNIIIKKGRFYYTPPVECGLLNGVFRRYLLDSGKIPLYEKILYRKDIKDADEVYLINSVRGMTKVDL
ncbi:MAG: aminodeoxychorismate synthase component I [Candidatus Omnitrophica bacterium]|nr:aminodeoxychorismate synthase component I [Candidatus Omnitrophota bacterium]